MRFIISVVSVAVGGPAVGSLLAHAATGMTHALAGVSAVLPDPATAAVMFAGLGLVVGARRGRSATVSD